PLKRTSQLSPPGTGTIHSGNRYAPWRYIYRSAHHVCMAEGWRFVTRSATDPDGSGQDDGSRSESQPGMGGLLRGSYGNRHVAGSCHSALLLNSYKRNKKWQRLVLRPKKINAVRRRNARR